MNNIIGIKVVEEIGYGERLQLAVALEIRELTKKYRIYDIDTHVSVVNQNGNQNVLYTAIIKYGF